MSNFSRIEYPTCPECLVLINDLKIFNFADIEAQNHFHLKECPMCKQKFLMKTRIELQTEVVPVSDY